MIHNNILLCPLEAYSSLKDFLKELGISKSQMTKKLSKKELARKVSSQKELTLPIDLINHLQINPLCEDSNVKITYEDENFVAIHKPYGLDGHSLNYSDRSCLSALRNMGRNDLLLVNNEEYERGMLYRLDRVTSGVLVFAKSNEVYHSIRASFQNVMKEKVYWALVKGKCSLDGDFSHFFVPEGVKGARMKVYAERVDNSTQGDLSILETQYSEEDDKTFVTVLLKTGLRHQIRSQMAFLGFPLVGDTLYGGEEAERVYLHAHCYKLTMNDRTIEFVDNDFLEET